MAMSSTLWHLSSYYRKNDDIKSDMPSTSHEALLYFSNDKLGLSSARQFTIARIRLSHKRPKMRSAVHDLSLQTSLASEFI
jgi:hypothetical protein